MQIGNEITDLGTLTFGALQSELGHVTLRAGANIAYQYVAVEPYVIGSIWHDFQGATTTTIPGGPIITQAAPPTFEQVGAGLSATFAKVGLTAYAQGNLLLGTDVHGWGATGGLRYSF